MKNYKFHFTFIKTIKFMTLRGISLKQICSKTNIFIMELHLKLTKKKFIYLKNFFEGYLFEEIFNISQPVVSC